MSDINWENGAVCYGDGRQWFANTDYESEKFGLANHDGSRKYSLYGMLNYPNDFQLNEIRIGDFIPTSELDTEEKYNNVVGVFGLFGFKRFNNASYAGTIKAKTDSSCLKVNPSGELICNWHKGDRQLTYHQIIAIGKLKRMMLEREVGKVNKEFNESEIESVLSNADIYSTENFPKLDLEEKPKRRNKSKQAYDILKSLDYEYDLVRQKWFKKQYID